ncbi:AsmA family protein [Maridesulfovibrio frigidus]|uniref:AsmA family protein n=1 Tax=Maridesulfovibrio frigidus TaxID=340956 RepID=UPI0004E148DF|nr:AsmA family protein [Maridesulfovibrio frigidus]
MLSRVKKVFWIIFLLFDLCLLSAIVGGIYYAESDGPRRELELYLSDLSGRKFDFEGNLDFVFYPWIGVNTGPFSVSSSPSENYPHQLIVENADFRVKLLPLLRGVFEVDTIIVDSPLLRVNRGEDGLLNLPIVEQSSRDSKNDGFERFLSRLSVRGVSVQNATCIYRDVASKNEFVFSGIDVRTGILRAEEPVAFNISASLDTDFLSAKAFSNIKGLLHLSLEDKTVSLSDTSCSLRVESEELLGADGVIEGIAGLDFDLTEGRVHVKGLVVQGLGIRLSGEAVCKNIYDSPDLTGSLKSTKFDPKSLLSKFLPKTIPPEFDKILNSASFSVSLHSTMQKTEVEDLKLALDDTLLRGEFSLQDYDNPWAEFNLRADSIVLDSYAKLFALRRASLNDQNATQGNKFQVKKEHPLKDLVIADLVRRIPCNGKVEVGKLVYDGLRMDNCRLSISPGPKVASISIENGAYLDGKFLIKADLAFDSAKEKDTLYLAGAGSISPVSLNRIPLKIDGLKIKSGKVEFMLGKLSSSGKTLGELFRNIKSDISIDSKSVIASLNYKDLPAKFRQLNVKNFHLGIKGAPLTVPVIEGMAGRNLKMNLSCALANPAVFVKGNFSGNVFAARRSISDVSLKGSKLDFSIEGKDVPLIKSKIVLACSGDASLKQQSIQLNKFSLSGGKVKITGDLNAKRLGSETATVQAHLVVPQTNLTNVFKLFGVKKPVTQDPSAFRSFALDSLVNVNGENVNLRINNCKLDDSTAKGTIELASIKKPVISFVLEADDVDVDKFLLPKDERNRRSSVSNGGRTKKVAEWEFPETFLDSINASGKVKCDSFRIFDFAGKKISANINMRDSVLDINNIKGGFHEGNVSGKLSLGFKNSTVALDTDIEARSFQAGHFFEDYTGSRYVTGLADASVKLSGHSTANIDFLNTLGGHFAAKIVDGSYLFSSVAVKDNTLVKVRSPKNKVKIAKAPKPTKFSIMEGTVNGDEGAFVVKKFLLKSAFLTALGSGGFDIPEDSIDLHIDADIIQLPNLYLKLVNSLFDAMSGVNVTVTGKLTDPDVHVRGMQRWGDVFKEVLGVPEQSFKFFRNYIF